MKKSIFILFLLCLGKVGMGQQINLPENFLNDSLTRLRSRAASVSPTHLHVASMKISINLAVNE